MKLPILLRTIMLQFDGMKERENRKSKVVVFESRDLAHQWEVKSSSFPCPF
jgi:hypothetical protein